MDLVVDLDEIMSVATEDESVSTWSSSQDYPPENPFDPDHINSQLNIAFYEAPRDTLRHEPDDFGVLVESIFEETIWSRDTTPDLLENPIGDDEILDGFRDDIVGFVNEFVEDLRMAVDESISSFGL